MENLDARPPIAPDPASWGFAEDFASLGERFETVRDDAISAGHNPISPGVAALLRLLARATQARAVVEIGTQEGVSGLALFAGMASNGILTSIDADAGTQLTARRVFTTAGVPSSRFRLIAGQPLEVLPNLRDQAYDLIFVNGDRLEYVECVAMSARLLRPGGLLVLNDALWLNLVADAANEDDETLIVREALEAVSGDEAFIPALLPVGGGVLVATRG